MSRNRKHRPPEREPVRYYFKVDSFQVGYSYSIRDPGTLSKHEVIWDYGGTRPDEPVTFGSLDLMLRGTLLDPLLEGVSCAVIELAVVERAPAEKKSRVAGILHRRGNRLVTYCWVPSIALESLLVLLSSGQRITIALDSVKLRYRKALVHDVNWYTVGHPELEAELEDIRSGE